MRLVDQFKAVLASWGPFSGDPRELTASGNGREAVVELESLDSLACAVRSVAVRSDRLAGATLDSLRRLSEQLARRLTYLLEPISPIEADADHCTVQLRSNPPQQGEGQTSYYELLVRKGGEISLVRYAKSAGATRAQITACLTREVLCRLIADFDVMLAP